MNHACLTYMENGRRKIMVAGGVIKTSSGQNTVTNTVEVLDWNTKLWKYDRATPRRMTGRGRVNHLNHFSCFPRFQADISEAETHDNWTVR